MRIYVHIGPDASSAERLQRVLAAKRDHLAGKGVLFARSCGNTNHTKLFMATSAPLSVDSLRYHRGAVTAQAQARLRADVLQGLRAEIARHDPKTLILAAHQFGTAFAGREEIAGLRSFLSELSEDIRIVAHVEEPARMLTLRYAEQLKDGRGRPLTLELGLTTAEDWWQAALNTRPAIRPERGMFADAQGAAHWLDLARLVTEWDAAFGTGATTLRGIDRLLLASDAATQELRESFGIPSNIGKAEGEPPQAPMSAAWAARARRFNDALMRMKAKRGVSVPRQLWRRFLIEMKRPGDPIAAGTLFAISERFSAQRAALLAAHPGLSAAAMAPDTPLPVWREADPEQGFRPSQYLLAFEPRIKQATREARQAQSRPPAPAPSAVLPPLARAKFESLQRSGFAPHNRLGHVDEEALAAAFSPAPPRVLLQGNTGRVIVACMKNEAPYILEWVAYHRAIGVDNFLIYTNGCTDGTAELLNRLQALGLVHHKDNEDWTGNSPQQFALDRAMQEPVVQNAEWLIHIDVDEFMNVRCGNGTLDDFLQRVPDATNVAMTWRLFGHNGVSRFEDRLVIDQFDAAAPRYCPKPHTTWGFKSMSRNIGAYGKLSCHRPNQLNAAVAERVKWVNGSGQDMTAEALNNGWRSSRRSIGYDLLQLNHYALRSAESFLIKRQRGRALHVDRTIGLNYWIRMDWSYARDITIKRNIPRVRAEMARLLSDAEVKHWHKAGVAWHQAKAADLHGQSEFQDLYTQALKLKLTETERVAYALALDMES